MHVHQAFCKYILWQITICNLKSTRRRSGILITTVESTVAETGSRIFIRVPVSLGNNLAGVAFVISSALLRACNEARGLFSLTSVCRAPCAAIPLAICNCFRSATKNETRNEDPDSRGL